LAVARSEKAVKSLKKPIPRNASISRPNDLKGLRPVARNRSFRLAKDCFRFRRFSASWRPKRISREIDGRDEALAVNGRERFGNGAASHCIFVRAGSWLPSSEQFVLVEP
jgi:hypothetical protein